MTVVLTEESGADSEHEELVCLSFCCSLPDASGRGFIEVLLATIYCFRFFSDILHIYPCELICLRWSLQIVLFAFTFFNTAIGSNENSDLTGV